MPFPCPPRRLLEDERGSLNCAFQGDWFEVKFAYHAKRSPLDAGFTNIPHKLHYVSRLDGCCAFWRAEESPGSMEARCRITSGGGDPRESATESKPPAFV